MKTTVEKVLHVELTRKPGAGAQWQIGARMKQVGASRYVIHTTEAVRRAMRADRDCWQMLRRLAA
jgi:hypothetical protein